MPCLWWVGSIDGTCDMLYNFFIQTPLEKINFLLVDKANLEKIIFAYNLGEKSLFFRGKTYNIASIVEIQIYQHEKGVFNDENELILHAKSFGFFKQTLHSNFISKEGLTVYGKNITENYIQGSYGYKKSITHITPNESRIKNRESAMQLAGYVAKEKLFISHSSFDERIVKSFVDNILRLGLGLSDKDIFCTSIEGINILNGDDFRNKIVDELKSSKGAILIITDNYKKSEVCLNEMGAIWALGLIRFPLISKPITFKNVGFLTEVQQIGQIYSSSDLDNFMESICGKLKIDVPKTTTWNSSKTKFLYELENLPNEKSNTKKNVEKNTPKLKWGMYKFDDKEGLYCPICYETKSLLMPTTRLKGGKYVCNNCKSNF